MKCMTIFEYMLPSSLKNLFSVGFKREKTNSILIISMHMVKFRAWQRGEPNAHALQNRSQALAEPIIHLIHTTHVLIHHF
jgi:hypothetical protein